MSMTGEISGVALSYVAREVKGKLFQTKTRYDKDIGENVSERVRMKNPVIVFFPNKTSQVFSGEIAEAMGFLRQPQVMNLQQVEDTNTSAGRYKHSISSEIREQAWMEMEQSLISQCMAVNGLPLDFEEAKLSEQSLYIKNEPVKQEEDA